MGFARRVGLGVKDFLSVPAKGALQVFAEMDMVGYFHRL